MAAKVGGGKGGRYSLGQNTDMNVTPFVDIMLVLLIIFMVSVPPSTLAIKVDLPPAQTDAPKNQKPTYISISRTGLSISNAMPTTLQTLGGDLARRFAVPRPTEENVLIRADRDVDYESFMAVVNQLQVDGYYKVALISEEAA